MYILIALTTFENKCIYIHTTVYLDLHCLMVIKFCIGYFTYVQVYLQEKQFLSRTMPYGSV
jgi:hypothetical protein